jgi:hypothetical protein
MATAAMEPVHPGAFRASERVHVLAQVLSLSPVIVLVAEAADGELARVPASAALFAGTLLWMLIGTFFIRRTGSPVAQSLALLVFTIPATIIAVVGTWLALAAVPPV